MLDFVLGVLDRVSLADQERIAIVPRKYLHMFSKVLDLYQTAFVLTPDVGPRTIGNWRFVSCKPLNLQMQLTRMHQDDLIEYEMLSDVLASYMSPKATSFGTIVADLRDESLVVAYRVLKLMRNLGIMPHVFLFLNFDRRVLSDFDKVNIASVISSVVTHGKYTIVPFSYDRVMKGSIRMEIVDYVEKCLYDLMSRLHERPVTGTYVPLCFRLEPASIFKDLSYALKLVFYIFTGTLEFTVESLSFGSIDVGKSLQEEARRLEDLVGNKVRVSYVDNDRLDVKALAEFSLRDVIAEGVGIISRTVSTGEAVEVLTNLRFLNIIKV